jgi:hypothetical protein
MPAPATDGRRQPVTPHTSGTRLLPAAPMGRMVMR